MLEQGDLLRQNHRPCEQHTSHVTFFLSVAQLMTRTCVAQVVCLACALHIPCFILMRSCGCFDLTLFDYSTFLSLLTIFSLIILSFFLPINFIFQGVVYKFPVHTSRRQLNDTSRNPQSRMGPRMTSSTMVSSTMTSPSARRSLHHCSPRSEKMMRAVDEPISLVTKVCRPVSRRPSVMIER